MTVIHFAHLPVFAEGGTGSLTKCCQPVLGKRSGLHTQSLGVPPAYTNNGHLPLCVPPLSLASEPRPTPFLTVHHRKSSAQLEGIIQRETGRQPEPEGVTGMGCQDLVWFCSRAKEKRARARCPQRQCAAPPFCVKSSQNSRPYCVTHLGKSHYPTKLRLSTLFQVQAFTDTGTLLQWPLQDVFCIHIARWPQIQAPFKYFLFHIVHNVYT